MNVLVINSGSSTIKYELFDMRQLKSVATGVVERIGEAVSQWTHVLRQVSGDQRESSEAELPDHRAALSHITSYLSESRLVPDSRSLFGIGHRVVHGGEKFIEPTLLSEPVLETIRELIPLAPLHNPANLLGIEVTMGACPDIPQVAVFDTAFHHTMPRHAYMYAIPYDYYQKYGIRRYGFHGTSHAFVAREAARLLKKPLESTRLITIHLGNGASAAAIDRGRCIDTSMGLTPLEGLMMGTRSGDLDPAVLPFLADHEHLSPRELNDLLNKKSGLQGICGANDMRDILSRAEQGDALAQLAVEMYAYRIKKYIGAYLAALGGADAIVFTAGIGENAAGIRHKVCENLASLGIELDTTKNELASDQARSIQTAASSIELLVVPTDEELEIAQQTVACIRGAGGSR